MQLADHKGQYAQVFPIGEDAGQAIVCLSVSDTNKELLLSAEGFIPLLIDSLLLDPEHSRKSGAEVMGATDFEKVKGPVQRVSDSAAFSLSL